MESIFTFLFKYRPLLFQEGDFAFAAPWPVLAVLLVAGAAAAAAVATYAPPRGKAGPVDRTVMAVLRVAALGVLLFALFQPTLVLTSTVPQRNFVGILVDDSRSMTLTGEDGRPRSSFVDDHFGPDGSDLLDQLEERFAVRYYRFSATSGRVDAPGELTYDGTRTDLNGALDHARQDLSSVPLSGLIVLSDGADNAGGALAEALVPLQAASVPVYTVGLGEEALTPDIQVGRVAAPRTVLQGTSLLVDVIVSQRGFGGTTVPLVIDDDQHILAEETVVLAGADEPTVTRVRFTLDRPGTRLIRFRIPDQEGERVVRNNQRSIQVEVRESREKILYFEGEPRWELKFVRRAVAEDDNVQVVILQRTAENKYLRLDVDDGEELAAGFPRTREELFRYRGLIIGSVEASFFTHDQLAMIADFASQRGGGVLFLGGRNAFAEGGYEGTPVAEAMPVVLEEPAHDVRQAFTEVKVRPTVAGLGHVAAQIRPDGQSSGTAWDSLPALSTLNRIQRVKPGATTLLVGDASHGEQVVLAFQRYGRGKVLAMPVQDVWTWQMHQDIPLEDQTHETFWQQLLRWLVDGVPEPVDGRLALEQAEAGESVRVVAEVSDSSYLAVNAARVTATVTAPDGGTEVVPLEWTLERDGEYAGAFTPGMDGSYEIAIDALRGEEEVLGTDDLHLSVGPSDEEYFDAGLRRPVLERLANETGGRFYTPGTVGDLPEDLRFTGGGVTLTEERDLWDMPFLFLMLVALVGGEWFYRRTRGLV
jgi:uncharacterized membrane protein